MVDFIDNQTKEIIKINQQKDKLLKSLERQNQELNEYAHMVSHDLKSPLQSIDALTIWLQEDFEHKLGNDGKETINLIRENVEKIDTLLSAILKYATIGKKDRELHSIDADNLLSKIVEQYSSLKNISIHIPKKLPQLKADNYRLTQLFKNLIDNAIKFNDKATKKVEIGFLEEENSWQFYVSDNGKGFEKEYFKKIFTAFFKLENDYKSAGIGLSIVKKIIEIYKGKIWVESQLNLGSTFYFTIKK